MKTGKIKKIIVKKIKEVKKLSKKIAQHDFDKNAIHDFRTAVKSLRAFLRLLQADTTKPNPKMTHKFKRLYHISGAIRDAQLELEKLAADEASIPVYTGKLHDNIKRQQAQWQKLYSKKIFRRLSEKLSAPQYKRLLPSSLATFQNAKIRGMKALSETATATNDQVHSMRKHAKDILYTTSLAKKEWKPGYKNIAHNTADRLTHVTDIIGGYNDMRIQLEHLRSFSSIGMKKDEADYIARKCRTQEETLRLEKKEILKMVNGIAQN